MKPYEVEDARRPDAVLRRDHAVALQLQYGQQALRPIADQLGIGLNLAYNSISRLHRAGQVQKVRIGGRTPVWELTPAGIELIQRVQAEQAAAAAAPAAVVEAPIEATAVPVG